MFCDTTKMPVMKKRVQPMNEQDPFESRRFVTPGYFKFMGQEHHSVRNSLQWFVLPGWIHSKCG